MVRPVLFSVMLNEWHLFATSSGVKIHFQAYLSLTWHPIAGSSYWSNGTHFEQLFRKPVSPAAVKKYLKIMAEIIFAVEYMK